MYSFSQRLSRSISQPIGKKVAMTVTNLFSRGLATFDINNRLKYFVNNNIANKKIDLRGNQKRTVFNLDADLTEKSNIIYED